MKLFRFTLFLLVVISSCTRDEEYCPDVLRQEERNQIPYKYKDTLILKDNNSLRDTFIVGKHSDELTNYSESDFKCIKGSRKMSINIYPLCTIYKMHNTPVKITFNETQPFNEFAIEGTPENNILINGTNYNNVIIVSKDSNNILNDTPWKIYYSNSLGILRIDYRNNKYKERVN